MFTNKQLKKLIIPLIIEQLLAILVGMMDVMMVSQVGEAATSGVSLVDSITALLIQAFSALATGGSVIAANFIGKKSYNDASKATNQLVVSNFIIGIIIMLPCLIFREGIIDGVYGSIEADVKNNALIYFLITGISYPALAVYNSEAAVCRAVGNASITMKASIIVNIVNVTGNALLIMVFHMGTAGVAIPTLISRVLGAVILFFYLSGKDPHVKLSFKGFRFDFRMIGKILRIGIPTGIDGSIFQIGKLLVASLVSSLGTVSITANAVMNTLANVVIIPGIAIGLAMVTVVGQCIGAGEVDQSVAYTKKLMIITYIAMVITGSVIGFGAPLILKLFNLSPETFEMTRKLAVTYVWISMTFWPTAFALQNALRAGGDATFVMAVSIISMWLFRIGCSYLLVNHFGLGVFGIWIAMYIDWVVRGVFFVTRFISRKWIKLISKPV